MIGPTPLLDFFKRGEVARDVRLVAAQGALAPRPFEQLAILIHLQEDPDPEVRATAIETLDRIPVPALQAFLARPDIPVDLREFFGDRGVFPDQIPPIDLDAEAPLIDTEPPDVPDDVEEGEDSVIQKLAKMSFPERMKAAMKGTKEMRSILIRDSNKLIAASVLSSPKLTDSEVEKFSRMASISEDVLRTIAHNRQWTKIYGVLVGLTKNPKTPVSISLNLMNRLHTRDMNQLSVDRNVPEPLRLAARKRVVASTSGKG